MKGIEEFKLYLKEWCEKNNKPLPKENQLNEVWYQAWDSFVKEELKPEWEERKQEYLEMQFVHANDSKEEVNEVEQEESGWEKVQKFLK